MKWASVSLFLAGAAVAGPAVEVNVPSENCTVRTRPYHPVSGYRCFGSELMVGIQSQNPQVILCARLEVSCPSLPFKGPEQSIETDGNAG